MNMRAFSCAGLLLSLACKGPDSGAEANKRFIGANQVLSLWGLDGDRWGLGFQLQGGWSVSEIQQVQATLEQESGASKPRTTIAFDESGAPLLQIFWSFDSARWKAQKPFTLHFKVRGETFRAKAEVGPAVGRLEGLKVERLKP
jgi:hypothetical protein